MLRETQNPRATSQPVQASVSALNVKVHDIKSFGQLLAHGVATVDGSTQSAVRRYLLFFLLFAYLSQGHVLDHQSNFVYLGKKDIQT